MRKRWICQKCGYVQAEDYNLYHRCTQCGSIDIELKIIDESMSIENNKLIVAH